MRIKQISAIDIEFRVSEISGWIKEFIRNGMATEAGVWAKELVRIARQLETL